MSTLSRLYTQLSDILEKSITERNLPMKQPCVYIITNKSNGTLYTGVTSDLPRRIYQHKQKLVEGFSEKYDLDKLVWYQTASTMEAAITEEKRIKAGSREAKIKLIQNMNPQWRDLYKDIVR